MSVVEVHVNGTQYRTGQHLDDTDRQADECVAELCHSCRNVLRRLMSVLCGGAVGADETFGMTLAMDD